MFSKSEKFLAQYPGTRVSCYVPPWKRARDVHSYAAEECSPWRDSQGGCSATGGNGYISVTCRTWNSQEMISSLAGAEASGKSECLSEKQPPRGLLITFAVKTQNPPP